MTQPEKRKLKPLIPLFPELVNWWENAQFKKKVNNDTRI
jgi:hypothetical protein